MAFGYVQAQPEPSTRGYTHNILMQNPTFRCRPSLMRPSHSNSFLPPVTEVKLCAPVLQGTSSGVSTRLKKRSALIWLSEWLLNWQTPVVCFSDAGFQDASSFSALSKISLKAFKITEADWVPVRVLGAEEFGAATRHYLKTPGF